ncbi:MAG TPA: hypothetical protein VH599_14560 [Ktedonobacterales bacterium]
MLRSKMRAWPRREPVAPPSRRPAVAPLPFGKGRLPQLGLGSLAPVGRSRVPPGGSTLACWYVGLEGSVRAGEALAAWKAALQVVAASTQQDLGVVRASRGKRRRRPPTGRRFV